MTGGPELPAGWRIMVESEMSGIEVMPFVGGRLAFYSAPRPGKETPNEDAVLVAPLADEIGVLGLADGAGGLRGGAQAAGLAVEVLAASLQRWEPGRSVRERVLKGLEDAHRGIAGLGLGAATTFAGVEIRDGRVRSFHAGDSVILVIGQRGKRKLQTVPHSPVGYALEAGLLDEREALDHQDLHLVSNMLGVGDPTIEMSTPIRLASRDTVVIASDGLFDNLLSDEVVDCLRKGDLGTVTGELIDLTRRRMVGPLAGEPSKPDDLGILVFRPSA